MDRTISNSVTDKSKGKAKQLVRVLIADDHKLFRQVLRKRIEKEDDMTVVGEAADGKEAITLTIESTPDVILMDINMPEMDGIEATRKIIALGTHVRIVGFSMHDHKVAVDSMMNAGAVAYATKDSDINNLCDTIRKAAARNHS